MIAVRLLGGAKKALGADTMKIDADSSTVGDILDMVESRTSGALAASNVLVAVNGADSSAAGGRGAVVRAGDDVAVIPVVHGGGGGGGGGKVRGGAASLEGAGAGRQIAALVSVAAPRGRRPPAAARVGKGLKGQRSSNARTIEAYAVRSGGKSRGGGVLPALDDLRAEFPSVAIQAVSGRFILGAAHLRRVIAVSMEAERRRTMLARRIETDILARLAGTAQISEAIGAAGRKGTGAGPYVVIAVAPAARLAPLRSRLAPLAAPRPALPASNARFLARRFGITAGRMSAVAGAGGRPLEDLLVEGAAVAGI